MCIERWHTPNGVMGVALSGIALGFRVDMNSRGLFSPRLDNSIDNTFPSINGRFTAPACFRKLAWCRGLLHGSSLPKSFGCFTALLVKGLLDIYCELLSDDSLGL